MLLEQIDYFIRRAIEEAFSSSIDQIPVEFPQDRSHGDLTINAFLLAKSLRLPPLRIAEELARALGNLGPIDTAATVRGFVNLKLSTEAVFQSTVPPLLAEESTYGRGKGHKGLKLMVEFSAPNTNKPLHLGHMRNNFLGDAVSRLLQNDGAEVVKANLLNDRGIHICKSMLAYKLFGDGATPESTGKKGDHLVGEYYVLFETKFREEVVEYVEGHTDEFATYKEANAVDRKGKPVPEATLRKKWVASFKDDGFGKIPLGKACQDMLKAWEAGDQEVHALWEQMNGWAISGFEQTYKDQGISFDVLYRESETYALGKELVQEGLNKKVFYKRDDGAVEIDLRTDALDKKVVLRSDGTSVYITQDIGTTVMKAEQHKLDGQIWVVGNEQEYHFKVLFRILQKLGYEWADRLTHLSYGMVNLPDGKMKSREGTVVDSDDLLAQVANLALEEIEARDPTGDIDKEEKARRAQVIALASLRFMLLKVSPEKDMTFIAEDSVRFDGDTGARVLYAYARLQSLLNDGGEEAQATDADFTLLTDETERHVALDILAFPRIAERAARGSNPQPICAFLLDMVRDMNRFYDRCSVLKEEDAALRQARLLLCRAAAGTIEKATSILGLPLLDRM